MAPHLCIGVLRSWTTAALAGFILFSSTMSNTADAANTPDPLFLSDGILDVRVVAPLTTILASRQSDEELPATLHYQGAAGEDLQFDIQIRTRGKFRNSKRVCKFPPLRLNFRKSQTKNTLFDKQDKIKLVTHCQSRALNEQVVLREYIAYRILNLLTNVSFRVRLLRITYADTDAGGQEQTRYGFLIEHRERLAKRVGKSTVGIGATTVDSVDGEHMNTVSLFHYLIGNTDFSPIAAAAGNACCHNHVLIGNDNERFWSVPYDFDQSGFVDAPYGITNPRFKLRNARQRLYRGRCVNNAFLRASIELFAAKRGEIETLIRSTAGFNTANMKKASRFIDRFYKSIESERQIQNKLIEKCL